MLKGLFIDPRRSKDAEILPSLKNLLAERAFRDAVKSKVGELAFLEDLTLSITRRRYPLP
jgi:hypothetical protein